MLWAAETVVLVGRRKRTEVGLGKVVCSDTLEAVGVVVRERRRAAAGVEWVAGLSEGGRAQEVPTLFLTLSRMAGWEGWVLEVEVP